MLLVPQDLDLWVCATPEEVSVKSLKSQDKIASIKLDNVVAVDVSPKGSFLVTFERPGQDSAVKNLKVWRMSDVSKPVYQQVQRVASKEAWPLFQFSDDEKFMFKSVSNEVHLLNTEAFAEGVQKKLRVKGVNTFAISSGQSPKVALYVPETKGAPGSVQIYDLSEFAGKDENRAPQASARKSFYRSSRAKLLWNSIGNALLAWAFSDVDKTNQSYYGEQSLHYLSANGDLEQRVELKDGPIHDVKWAPNGEHFVAVHGFMPAKATLFNYKCKPIYDFGSGPRNTVRWSPFGRFLALGGFGTLPGDIEFFDKKADGKCKLMGSVRAPCTVDCSWAPDGRHLITCTTSPRLRVDNGYKIFRYNGDLIHEESLDILLQVEWGTYPKDSSPFEDRPASPDRIRTSNGKAASAQASKPKAYVPPHLKNSRGGSSSSSSFSLAYDSKEASPGKIKSQSHSRLPPGAEPAVSKAASKNAKRRAKKNAKLKEQEQTSDKAKPVGKKDDVEALSKDLSQQNIDGKPSTDDVAKKIRNLEKKLRQIEQLKEKPRDSLTSEQVQKLETEVAIRQEVNALKR